MTLKRIFLGAAMLLSIVQVFAQNCVRQISTRHDSSYNNELPPYYPSKINPWLNTFNFAEYIGPTFSPIQLNPSAGWNIPGYTGGTLAMVSPFSPSMGSGYEYLWGPTGNAPYQQDIHWKDGWELMWLNTGYYPNGEPVNLDNPNRITALGQPLANPKTPYMVLYNRYTGKLRVFANIFADLNAYDSARLTLVQSSVTKSGIFRNVHNYDRSLDEPTKVTQISSANFLNKNNNTVWWSTDFQLGYDPCVCQHPSSFELQVRAASTLDVDLFGRSVGLVQNIGAYNGSFLSNETIRQSSNTTGDGGSLIFKTIGGMIDNYNQQMDLYNTRLKSYNAPMNQGLRLILGAAKDGISNAGGTFVNNTIGDLALRALVMLDGPPENNTATAKKWAEQASKAAKGAIAKEFDNTLLPNLGVDFLDAPIKPSMPTATFSEMRLAGSITDRFSVQVSNLLTPGSYTYGQTLTPFNYPSYNNAVGLFALLHKPQVYKLYDTSKFREPIFVDIDTVGTTVMRDDSIRITIITQRGTQTWEHNHEVKLRLKDPLKYKLNRALDFDDNKSQLYVSFVVEMDNAIFDSTACFSFNPTSTGNMYMRDAFPAQNGQPYQAIFESQWEKMEDIGEKLFAINFTNTFNTFLDRDLLLVEEDNLSPTVTVSDWVDCINEVEAMFNIKRVKMKIAADMYFDQIGSNGLQNNTFQSFTYLLYDRDAGVDIMNTTQDSLILSHYKQRHLVLTNETIETTDPFVMETRGSTIYVNAETIELNGTIDVQSGYKAVLQATRSIRSVSGNTNVSNKVKMQTVNGFSRFDRIQETSQTELQSFCQNQSTGYKALQAAAKTGEIEEPTEESQQAATKISTQVYPNPTTNVVNVAISATDKKEYTFQVFDLTGRALINEQVSGVNQPVFEINTSGLSGGSYLLRISTTDGAISDTHRLVIVK